MFYLHTWDTSGNRYFWMLPHDNVCHSEFCKQQSVSRLMVQVGILNGTEAWLMEWCVCVCNLLQE